MCVMLHNSICIGGSSSDWVSGVFATELRLSYDVALITVASWVVSANFLVLCWYWWKEMKVVTDHA